VTLIDRAAADLRLVAEYWPGLAELRDPSVYAPRPASLLTPEQRAENDHAARIERQERDGLMPGEHQDAARADVLDLMASLAYDADDLAEEIARVIMCPRPEPGSSAFADPAPLLDFAIRHLREANRADSEVGNWAAAKGRNMLTEVGRALCLTHDGQLLQAVCLWCDGRTEMDPAGGARTWRVRDLLGGLNCTHGRPDRAMCERCNQLIAIVCESGTCAPPDKFVGTWFRGQPAWPLYEWDWLAKQLLSADEREKMNA
jgi:hypothetical protein